MKTRVYIAILNKYGDLFDISYKIIGYSYTIVMNKHRIYNNMDPVLVVPSVNMLVY